jgi:hypothetical protein
MMAKLRITLLHILAPLTRLVGKIHSPWTRKLIKAKHLHELQRAVLPGHVILTMTRGELTNLIIPGTYKHGALCLSTGSVIEATTRGVVQTDMIDFALSKDAIAVLEPIFEVPEGSISQMNGRLMVDAAAWARDQEGKAYDFELKDSIKEFYCFELLGQSYLNAWQKWFPGKECPWVPRETMGVLTFTGDDFLKAKNKWRVIWTSR